MHDHEAEQGETIRFLAARGGDAAEAPVATHISRIFFAGDRVYKLKRAVRTPYLDFTTVERRLAACEQELTLNRRTAPTLYRAVRRITRDADGLAFDGAGPLVDAVVEMARFDEACLLDRMAQRSALGAAHMETLAAKLATFHADAPAQRSAGGAGAMSRVLQLNERSVAQSLLASDQACAAALAASRAALARLAPVLDRRRGRGRVRRCHGDLTLRNICLIEEAPTPFDCLEFDEELATIDVLYDLAFPLMDLWRLGRPDLASILFNRYLDRTTDEDGVGLLPFFIATRAIIRAHVAATAAQDAEDEKRDALMHEAHADVRLANLALTAGAPRLIAIGGFSGSGKSTVAAALAPRIGPPPGARILSSDRLRKGVFGVAPTQRLPADAYTPAMSRTVYALARKQAAQCLAAGSSVIADAVFDHGESRAAIEAVAEDAGVAFNGVWLEAAADVLSRRVEKRRGDPSDADVSVLQAQTRAFSERAETLDWRRYDSAQAPETLAAEIAASLESDAT